MYDILYLRIKHFSSLILISSFIIFSIVFFSSFINYSSFLDDNVSYVVTIETEDSIEVVHCIDIDFNYGSLFSSPDDYYTLQFDDVTFRNVPKDVTAFSYETVYEVEKPNFFDYLKGDYDD